MFVFYFQRQIDEKNVQRPRQAQTWGVQQVQVMFIIN